jgi:hypothetical protein
VTRLRKMMLEELQRRNYSEITTRNYLRVCRQLLAFNSSASAVTETRTSNIPSDSTSLWHCPRCGTAMIVIQRLTAMELSQCLYIDSS